VFPTHQPTQNTALPAAQPKMADAIFGFGHSHALESSSVFVRKNSEILKVTVEKDKNREWQPQHATSGFTRLRHYPRLKIFSIFAVGCSLGSVSDAATS